MNIEKYIKIYDKFSGADQEAINKVLEIIFHENSRWCFGFEIDSEHKRGCINYARNVSTLLGLAEIVKSSANKIVESESYSNINKF